MQFVRVHHEFVATITSESPDPDSPLVAAVANIGNGPEVLLRGFVLVAVEKRSRAENYGLTFKPSFGPVAVKPGEKLALRFTPTLDKIAADLELESEETARVFVVLTALDADGSPVISKASVAQITPLRGRGKSISVAGGTLDLLREGEQTAGHSAARGDGTPN